jgi:hypothetical protein
MAGATAFPSNMESTKTTKGEEVAMRMKKAFLSTAVVTVVGLAAATAMAQTPSTECIEGFWTLTLESGPVPGSCNLAASTSGQCTRWNYKIVSSNRNKVPDHVAGAADDRLLDVETPQDSGNQLYFGTDAEPVFGLGSGDITTTAWKLNPYDNVFSFTLVMDGIDTTTGLIPVDIKKGGTKAYCAIAGPAPTASDANPLETFVEETEEVLGGKCKVRAKTDKLTGETVVELLPGSDPDCEDPEKIPIDQVKVLVDDGTGGRAEPVLLSEGFSIILGTGTCIYKQYYPTRGPVYRICW